jgi:hypothetical protein
MPGLPNPYTGLFYRLQLGSFSTAGHAAQCFQHLLYTGFIPFYEQYGTMYRVVLPGIRAVDVYGVILRLEAAGFTDVWVRQER